MINIKRLLNTIFLIPLTLFLTFFPLIKVFADSYQAYISGNAVRLRNNPTTKNSDILDTLYVGNQITVLDSNKISGEGCSEGWLKIRYLSEEGYTCSKYITQTNPNNGDKYDRPWTTPYKAILGGAKWIASGYIGAGQFTSYLKKYNVNPSSSYQVYNHQYQSNIAAPASEAISSWRAYDSGGFMKTGTNSFPFVFTIPVYNNMADSYNSPDGYKANLSTSTQTDNTFEQNIKDFPDSYKPYLRDLHKDHPNWIFKALKTNLNFEEAANIEMTSGAIQKVAYRYRNESGNYIETESNWYRPNIEATRFYMDPRNWLNESYIFMFEDLTYNSVFTESVVQTVLNKKTLISGYDNIDNKTYASIFVEAGKIANVNSVYLASLSVQEISSDNISGTQFEYEGTTYSGLFNFYNIGAVSSASNPLKAGLVYAAGGICTICANYNNQSNNQSSQTSNNNEQPKQEQKNIGNISNIGASIMGSYIKGFNVGTSISDLKNRDGNISYDSSDIIKTGTIINTGNATYTAIVYGDVSGDGKINSADLLKLRQYMLGKASLNGAYLEAAKISGSNINSATLLKMRQYLLGKTNINQS